MTQKHRQRTHKSFSLRKLFSLTFILLLMIATAVYFSQNNKFKQNLLYDSQNNEFKQVEVYDENRDSTQDLLVLVNRWKAIPDDFHPHLVQLANGQKVDRILVEPLEQLINDASGKDMVIEVLSGYRSREEQKEVMEDKIHSLRQEGYSKRDAEMEAAHWVASPGHSEHETGLAVDLTGSSYDIFEWLANNAHHYGFIRRYPEDKIEVTGVAGESWHFRYVGIEAATAMYENEQVLEEYLADKG